MREFRQICKGRIKKSRKIQIEQRAAPSYQPGKDTRGHHKRAHNLIIKSNLKH